MKRPYLSQVSNRTEWKGSVSWFALYQNSTKQRLAEADPPQTEIYQRFLIVSIRHQPHLLPVDPLEVQDKAAHFPAAPGYSLHHAAGTCFTSCMLVPASRIRFSQISSVCNSLKSKFVRFNLEITFEAFTASFIQTFYLCISAHLNTDAFPVMQDQDYKQDYDLNWIILSVF